MLKNSKLLKGIVISLACIFVLGGAFFLQQWADANEKVVTLYVDDNGDNTTGADIASAYTSIGAATEAAAKMGLAPGTEVHILVGEQITLTTQSIDVNVVTDTNGDKVPVVVSSLNTDDPSNYAVIYHAYRQQEAVPTNPSQRARIINNLTLKDIVLKSKVHEIYVANNDTGKLNDLYRVRSLYVDGNDVVFDNVKFTSDLGDKVGGNNAWTVYCDNCTASDEKGDPTVTFKNGDYTNIYIYGHAAIMPNYDITVNVENSQLGSIYVIANSNKTDNLNCNSLKASFKDSSIKIFNFANGGDYTIPDGIEITFDGTTVDDYRVKTDKREDETIRGDLTFNFKGDTYIYNSDTLYLAPMKELRGNLTTNFSGGTYPISVFPAGYRSTITGNIVNNISGGEFKKFFCASSRCGYVGGTITNNISGSPTFTGKFIGGSGAKTKDSDVHVEISSITNTITGSPTFKAAYYGGSLDGTIGTVKNKISGTPTFEANFFGGGGDGTVLKDKTTGEITFESYPDIDSIDNQINGGTFKSSYYGGNHAGVSGDINNNIYGDNTVGDVVIGFYFGGGAAINTLCGNITNNLVKTVISSSYYAAGDTTLAGDITTIIGDNVTVTNNYYGGSYGTNPSTCGNIVNKFTGKNILMNQKAKGNYAGGLRVSTSTSGSIKNYIEAEAEVTFGIDGNNYYYGGNADGVCGNVENYFKAPAVVNSTYCGGNKAGSVQNVYNEFSGGVHFKSWVYASSAGADYTKDTINYVTHATFEKFMCGGPINKTGENVLNHITSDKVVFKQSYFGGTYAKGSGVKSVTNYIADGVKFEGKLDTQCAWLGGKEGTTEGKTLNIISGVEFYGKVICGRNDGNCGDIYNEFTNCKLIKTVEEKDNKTTTYGGNFIGGCQGTVKAEGEKTAQCGAIINNLKDTEIGSYYYAGSTSDDAVAASITNHLSGVTLGDMYVGGSVAGKVGTIINNLIADNVFKGSFYGGSYGSKDNQARIEATVAGDIYNYISGASFEKMYYGGNYNGTSDNVHNYILGTVPFAAEFYGAGRLGACKDVENIFFENAELAKDYYGGGEEGARIGKVQSILANGTFKGYIVGGSKTGGEIESIETTFYNKATHDGYYYGGNRGGAASVGSVTNNIYTGTFTKWFVGGSTSGTCGDITNNIMGDITFKQSFYGGTHGNGTTGGNVTNNIYNASFVGTNINAYNVWLGGSYGTEEILTTEGDTTYVSLNHPTVGNVTNTLVGVTFKCKVYGGMRYGITGNIVNNISSCDFEKEFAGGCHAGQTGDITNNIDANTLFTSTYYGGNRQAKYPDDIIKSETKAKYDENGWIVSYMDSIGGNVTNNVYSATFSGEWFCAGSFTGVVGNIENNIYSNDAIFKTDYFGGGYDGSAEVKNISNNIEGGVFKKTVSLAGRNAKTFEKVYSVISGGTFDTVEPLSANFSYADKEGDITLVFNPDLSSVPLVIGGKGVKNTENATIILKGAEKAVQLSLDTGAQLDLDSIELDDKKVIFFNNETWKPGQVYVVLPDTTTAAVLSEIVLQSVIDEEVNLAEVVLQGTNYVVIGKTI